MCIRDRISDALQVGKFDKVTDSIGALKSYTKSKTEGAALPDIIRSWDKTLDVYKRQGLQRYDNARKRYDADAVSWCHGNVLFSHHRKAGKPLVKT